MTFPNHRYYKYESFRRKTARVRKILKCFFLHLFRHFHSWLFLLALSKVLEIEFIYLPLNIPNPSSSTYLNILKDLDSSNYWSSGVSYGLTAENKQLYQLKGLCENARLSGGVSAIQAAAESFRPFLLESVAEVDLTDGACSRILQAFGGSTDLNRIYPPPLTTSTPYNMKYI